MVRPLRGYDVMSRMFGLVDTKVQETEYFLERILNADLNFFGVQCDAVAFASSARSISPSPYVESGNSNLGIPYA